MKRGLKVRFVTRVKPPVLPHVEKLTKSRLEPQCAKMIGFIQTISKKPSLLASIVYSPLTSHAASASDYHSDYRLDHAGRTAKDIAEALYMTKEAIDKQRFLIRKKLGLNKGKVNLRSHLLTLL